MGFLNHQPVSMFFPVLGDLIVLDLLQVLDIPWQVNWLGEKVDSLGKKLAEILTALVGFL